ncbi:MULTISPECIES: hypothetical protein [unclassified Microcoleus]|uniref:hypothetical protein n=1 Tax=unclassified Microcoleus TaxID=2642155 RepID=UPI002FCFE526
MLNKNKINSARVAVHQTININLITNLLHRKPYLFFSVADLRYERLNMPVIETSIDKAWGFSTDLFHTLIKQRLFFILRSFSAESALGA